MKTIILDTNFLMIPIQFHIDIIDEISRICSFSFELAIVDKTIDELVRLQGEAKTKVAATIGLQLIEKHKMRIIETDKQKHVDALILAYCKENDCVVATQDTIFREWLRAEKIPCITMRQKTHLVLMEP